MNHEDATKGDGCRNPKTEKLKKSDNTADPREVAA
jgi:hypothetical protein